MMALCRPRDKMSKKRVQCPEFNGLNLFFSRIDETRTNGDTDPSNTSKMQLQQQLSQQQQELLQQLQLLHHQYLMHHGINLQQQFLGGHKQKSHQLNGGKCSIACNAQFKCSNVI